MIRSIALLLFLLTSTMLFGQGSIVLQDKPFVYNESRDTSVWNKLVTNPSFRSLSGAEQEFFYWTNLFRKSPSAFNNKVIKEFLKQFPEAVSASSRSLQTELSKVKNELPFVSPDFGLNKMATEHANDLKKRNAVLSHQSAAGKNFVQRIKEAGNYRCGAENLFLGNPSPLEALLLLLIDEGVKDKGHRKNLLDPSFTLMGISSLTINPKKVILVQEFGCK